MEKFCETTVAYDPPPMDSRNPTPKEGRTPEASQLDLTQITEHKDAKGQTSKVRLTAQPKGLPELTHDFIHTLFHRPYFHVHVVNDVAGMSIQSLAT